MNGYSITNPAFEKVDNFYATPYHAPVDRADDPELQANILAEQQRAQERYEQEYEYQK